MLVDFISSLQLSSETVKRYVLNKPDRKLFGKALFRHYTKQEDKAQIWLAENMENKVLSKTKQNLNVLRESFTRDHKLIYSFSKKREGILLITCFIENYY